MFNKPVAKCGQFPQFLVIFCSKFLLFLPEKFEGKTITKQTEIGGIWSKTILLCSWSNKLVMSMHLNARSKPSWTECYIRWLWAALGHTNENFISQDKSCLCAGRVGMLFQAFPTKLSTSRALWSCVRLGPPVCRIACAQYVRIKLFCKREKSAPSSCWQPRCALVASISLQLQAATQACNVCEARPKDGYFLSWMLHRAGVGIHWDGWGGEMGILAFTRRPIIVYIVYWLGCAWGQPIWRSLGFDSLKHVKRDSRTCCLNSESAAENARGHTIH